jgi:hypothetical protein
MCSYGDGPQTRQDAALRIVQDFRSAMSTEPECEDTTPIRIVWVVKSSDVLKEKFSEEGAMSGIYQHILRLRID